MLNEEDVNSLIMIELTLMSCTFDMPPQPVLLDGVSESIKPDVVLLLDMIFHTLIFHKETNVQWRKTVFQDPKRYENFRGLPDAPVQDAQDLLMDPFPILQYIICSQGGSQTRFLLSKLNLSGYGASAGAGLAICTNDVSLKRLVSSRRCLSASQSRY